MGGRGSNGIDRLKKGVSTGPGRYGRTQAQDKAIKKLVKQTANLKNEQYRIIDSDGNVVLAKKGDKHSVAATVGEKRDYLDGNISLHNHPAGGTFSSADFSDFGYGAKEIVAAAPEGTYRLININFGKTNQKHGWVPLRDAVDEIPETSYTSLRKQAQENVKDTPTTRSLQAITDKWTSIRAKDGNEAAKEYFESVRDKYEQLSKKRSNELEQEQRRLETKPFHDFYKKNAKKYGFKYVFEPKL